MLTKQHQIQAKEKEVHRDPRIGQRVICCSLLPTITLLGTIQRVLHYANGEEYWHVLTDGPMTEEAPATCFLLYEGPEFPAGARVRYRVGGAGAWRLPCLLLLFLRFICLASACSFGPTANLTALYPIQKPPAYPYAISLES